MIPNGTGSFVNNTTLQALTSTEYHPDANHIARSFVYLTLNAAANTGCADITKTVTLTINPISADRSVSADQTILAGTQPADLVLSGYTGTIIKWQQSADSAITSPADIANLSATLTGASIGNLNTTTYFRAVVKNGTCGNANSNFVIISVSTLPVTLLYFTGRCVNNAPVLEWATFVEYNNKYFTIEKSSDARNWNSIKTINGAGTSNLASMYSYNDSSTTLQANFYRLKRTDVDGRNPFSKVTTVSSSNQ